MWFHMKGVSKVACPLFHEPQKPGKNMRAQKILFGILILFFSLLIKTSPCIAKETSLTMIYTSNTLGEVEPCGTCPEGGDNGGLPRRSYYLKTIKEGVKNLLLLDGGDALVISYFGQPSEREKARRRAEFVLRLYEILGYHALNIGDTDLGLGVEYLKKLQRDVKIPFLSANLKEKKTGKPIFKPYLIKEVEGVKIGILGLITTEISANIQKELKNYSIENPTKTATEIISRLTASCDHIIALGHLTPPEVESLAKEVPRISIIIGGNDRSFIFPKQIYRSIYIQTDAFGAHVGRMNLNLIKGSDEFVDILPRTMIQKNIKEVQKKMEEPKYAKEIEKLQEMQKQFHEQLKKMPDTEGKNTFENHLPLMHPGMESDKEIEKLIDSSRDQLKRPIPW
jgi:2',3'-cyclic-nucleotide 2'-phosphodiesterase (5'-nucleotidase family)